MIYGKVEDVSKRFAAMPDQEVVAYQAWFAQDVIALSDGKLTEAQAADVLYHFARMANEGAGMDRGALLAAIEECFPEGNDRKYQAFWPFISAEDEDFIQWLPAPMDEFGNSALSVNGLVTDEAWSEEQARGWLTYEVHAWNCDLGGARILRMEAPTLHDAAVMAQLMTSWSKDGSAFHALGVAMVKVEGGHDFLAGAELNEVSGSFTRDPIVVQDEQD